MQVQLHAGATTSNQQKYHTIISSQNHLPFYFAVI
jgi:hypothetical protein